jgi:hypothetical protein
MSSEGRRKETRAWETSGGMSRSPGQVVVIDDAPQSTDAVEIVEDDPPSAGRVRVRKTTLESFNEEMAVLDRPLASEVEYVDEAPAPSRMKRLTIVAGVFVVMVVSGGLLLSRRQTGVDPTLRTDQPVALATAPARVLAAPTTGAPPPLEVAAAATPTADRNEHVGKDDQAASVIPNVRAAEKVAAKRGHAKRSRASTGKSSRHHGPVKHSVTVTHTRSRDRG